MKRILSVVLFFVFVYPSFAYGLVKLMNVSQKGVGNNTGTIKIELSSKYNLSKVKIKYESDHIEFLLPNTFVLPSHKIFKSSSERSSVLKMEARHVPVDEKEKSVNSMVNVSVFFKSGLEAVKKTGSLSLDSNGKTLVYTYKSSLAVAETTTQPTTQSTTVNDTAKMAPATPAVIQDNETKGKQASIKETAERAYGKPNEAKDSNKEIPYYKSMFTSAALFRLLKIGLLSATVVVLAFIMLGILRRFYVRSTKKQGSTLPNGKGSIRVIDSTNLNNGETVYIIEAFGERMLIASTKNNVTLLTKMTKNEGPVDVVDTGMDLLEGPDVGMRSRLKDKIRNI